MKIKVWILYFFILLTTICQAEWAYVEYVIDGDTIILDTQQRVRLIGVDTPEINWKNKKKSEVYAIKAKLYLEKLILKKKIRLEKELLQKEFDRYGRRLAYIYLENGLFINEELIRLGYGESIKMFPYKYKKRFKKIEIQAKKKKKGIWKKRRNGNKE